MKIEKLKKRLDRNRPMTAVTLRMPEDVVDDLKRIAPLLGFSGYQPLIRAYVGQCLRKDLERIDTDAMSDLVSSLKRRGVSQDLIEEALKEAMRPFSGTITGGSKNNRDTS
jgi:hypothetical protein